MDTRSTTTSSAGYETTLYSLYKPSIVEEDPIVLRDGSSRLYHYFVTDTIPGKFLQFTTAVGRAGDYLSEQQIAWCDYLQANTAIPIFSERAKNVLLEALPDEVEFHPLKAEVHGVEIRLWLCKVKTYCDVVDETRSPRRTLDGGGSMFERIVYRQRFDVPFHIARDRNHPFLVVVSQGFVDLCKANGLTIGFTRLQQ
jgi:hypothetical protein